MKRSGNLPHLRFKIDTAKIYSLEADPEIFAGEGYAQDILYFSKRFCTIFPFQFNSFWWNQSPCVISK